MRSPFFITAFTALLSSTGFAQTAYITNYGSNTISAIDINTLTVTSTFNAQGYGLILVDPKGVVRGANVREREIEGLLGKIYPEVRTK